MLTKIEVFNDEGEIVRGISIGVSSDDGINSDEAVSDANQLALKIISRWIHLEGISISISSSKTG